MDLITFLDELQTIARNGLNFTESPYDRERYEHLLTLVTTAYSRALDMPAADVRSRLSQELGYITPKVGANAAIFDDAGRILVATRTDNGRKCLPCGWLNPNEDPADAAVRETREETGLIVEVVQLVGVHARPANAEVGVHSAVGLVYLCEVVGGSFAPTHEVSDVSYMEIDDVQDWHHLHESYAREAREAWSLRRLLSDRLAEP
jgi:ADP-ribose pyrophosphatase YjhB (NUDIX family)